MSGDGAHTGKSSRSAAGRGASRRAGSGGRKKAAPASTVPGERIAKALSRAGVASRREAERMIEIGRVAVNGERLDSPARNVLPTDVITVDGKPIAATEPTRVFRYHKPRGVVTTARDEQGRTTIYDVLPEGLPRLMPVGRLDITSEGLLLLTNDGELKRRLELPATGWLRKYRVRVHGDPTEARLKKLEQGVTVDGERFQPMLVSVDRVQGANAWMTVGLREGRNREIRRAMEAVGLEVNRLIRTAYGPFRLGTLPEGAVEEAPTRVLNDQLGLGLETPAAREKRERSERTGAFDPAATPGAMPGAMPGDAPDSLTGDAPQASPKTDRNAARRTGSLRRNRASDAGGGPSEPPTAPSGGRRRRAPSRRGSGGETS